MKTALVGRKETVGEVLPNLAITENAYVYYEYLGERCVEDQNVYIHSPFGCVSLEKAPQEEEKFRAPHIQSGRPSVFSLEQDNALSNCMKAIE